MCGSFDDEPSPLVHDGEGRDSKDDADYTCNAATAGSVATATELQSNALNHEAVLVKEGRVFSSHEEIDKAVKAWGMRQGYNLKVCSGGANSAKTQWVCQQGGRLTQANRHDEVPPEHARQKKMMSATRKEDICPFRSVQ